MGGVAGSSRSGPLEGWSRAPLAARLPSIALVVLTGLGAVVRPIAPPVFVVVLFGYLVARRFRMESSAFAAVLPAAAILAFRSLPQPLADPTGADCADLLSPPAVWRFLEGVIGVVVVAALLLDRGVRPGDLGLRLGGRRVFLLAILALVVVGPIAVYAGVLVGGAFGGLFFPSYTLDLSEPLALAPALIFAASNATAEELAYRGAARVWLAPTLGVTGANVAQAILFGLSHTGDDFVSLEAAIPTALTMIVLGFIGGWLAMRLRSLTLPIAVHAAADLPLYFYWACRVL